MIKLIIAGEPVAQGRPKFTTRGGFVKAYDPIKSRKYKQYVATVARQQYKKAPLNGAICVSCTFYRPIQKTALRR